MFNQPHGPSSSIRRLLALVVAVAIGMSATPGASLAAPGGNKPKAKACDPQTTYCGDGRKNG